MRKIKLISFPCTRTDEPAQQICTRWVMRSKMRTKRVREGRAHEATAGCVPVEHCLANFAYFFDLAAFAGFSSSSVSLPFAFLSDFPFACPLDLPWWAVLSSFLVTGAFSGE